MKKHPIATIVNFCTNESRFLKFCIEQAFVFSRQVIIPVCDHFFDGSPENRNLLEQIYAAFPQCLFIEYPFISEKIFEEGDAAHFWHSLSRLLGFQFIDEQIESIFFLDADEIPDGLRVAEWLESSNYTCHTVLKMANHWYFRDACYRAEKWEDSIVLAQKRALMAPLLLKKEERDAIYHLLPGPKRRMVAGTDGQPLFHHYSWVRTEEEMLKKVRSWGHSNDKDWESLVKKEFSGPFLGVDFVHSYPCKTVNPAFPISFDSPIFLPSGKQNVIRMNPKSVLSNIQKAKESFWSLIFRRFP